MDKRFAATTVLGAILLFGQGANVLVAALCPHLQSPAASCIAHEAESAASHEHLNHIDGESGLYETAATDLNQPVESCPHCAMHSGSDSGPISLKETATANRAGDINIPLVDESGIFGVRSTVSVVVSRAHSPPADQLPRHILINVYRI